jgi:hypothetical protein
LPSLLGAAESDKRRKQMKSALEKLRELSEISKNYPSVVPLIGAVLELEEKLRGLEQSKEDKVDPSQLETPPQELTRGNLQGKLSRLLTAAGDKERAVAIKVHQLLTSLE